MAAGNVLRRYDQVASKINIFLVRSHRFHNISPPVIWRLLLWIRDLFRPRGYASTAEDLIKAMLNYQAETALQSGLHEHRHYFFSTKMK